MKTGKTKVPKRTEPDVPTGWLTVEQALSWIAARSLTSNLDVGFYFGASNWFSQTPDEALEHLRQVIADPPDSLCRTLQLSPTFEKKVRTTVTALGLHGDDDSPNAQTDAIYDITGKLIDHLSAQLQDARAQHDRLQQASDMLCQAIASGALSAYGWKGYGPEDELAPVINPRERIPADVCAGPVIITAVGIVPVTQVDGRSRISQPIWSGILMTSDGVLSLWPASVSESQAELRPHAVSDCLRDSDGTPARRPQYSRPLLGGWYLARVHGWPKDAAPPTEAQDLADAREAFEGDIPRSVIREIRKAKAPQKWLKSGPRKPR